jgi:hypothetical protein
MPAQNYVLLERIELNATTASVTFASIPQTGYTDLKIVLSARSDYAGVVETCNLQINGVTTATYPSRYLQGDGAAASSATTNISGSVPIGVVTGNTATASTFGSVEIYLPNYTDSSNYQSLSGDSVSENNATTSYARLSAGLWQNNAAVTTIAIFPYLGTNWLANSTFSLYGISALGTTPVAPKAEGGNQLYSDGTYWYHIFTTSGTFRVNQALTCDYLVVAGGGGGGKDGGGGGGGGLRSTVTATGGGGTLESALAVAASSYSITVGAGGASGASGVAAASGTNSIFSSITSTGGGAGGGDVGTATGYSGGSGGGTKRDTTNNTGGGAGTANQGYAGGVGCGTAFGGAGGGGGTGATGGKGTSTGTASGERGGVGGAGVATSITGTSVTRGGGGGGANFGSSVVPTGGSGGGGNGGAWDFANSYASRTYATSGTANTGGGGGGDSGSPGTGGSGIVIIRYTA